jgi:hypothetical protein
MSLRRNGQPKTEGPTSLPDQSEVENIFVGNITSGIRNTDLTEHGSSHSCSRSVAIRLVAY